MSVASSPHDAYACTVRHRAPYLLPFVVASMLACAGESGVDPDGGAARDGGRRADGGAARDAGATEDRDAGANARRDAGTNTSTTCDFDTTTEDALYASVIDLEERALRDALHALVTDGSRGFGYDAARNLMYGITGDVDVDADNRVTCAYTGVQVEADGTRSPGTGDATITTEHSWPRSDGAETFPAEGDLHHLFPAIADANGTRGVHEFGDVDCGHGGGEPSCVWSEGGSLLGPSVDGRPDVFEVRIGTRGDIARAHFYFATRYELPIPPEEEATLRRWHCADPPSDDERARNGRIAEHQRNRNPFVDQPQLVDRITDY